MNRVFTTREKILLVILAILLIGCFYYLVVLKPSLDTLASSESQLSAVQDEIALQQVVATKKAELEQQINDMEQQLAEITRLVEQLVEQRGSQR